MLILLIQDSVELGSQSEGLCRVFNGCTITWVAFGLLFDFNTY